MSTTVVREMSEAVERRDVGAFVERCQADAVWEHNLGGGSPEEGTYVGRDQIEKLFERIVEGWEYVRLDPAELSETGPGVYEVRGQMHFKHPTSEAEMVEPYEQHLEFRDGLLLKGRMVFGS
jgi:ketosteroid isomerase-like protein